MGRGVAVAANAAALIYLLVVGWAMARLSYDIWGALIVAPLVVFASIPLLRRAFPHDLRRLMPIAVVGLVAKFAGCFFRYWVSFDAYGGSDAGRYHDFGKALAGRIWDGEVSPLRAIPTGIGTPFMERLTALVYTLFGSSRLAGFLLFGWLAFWGAVLFVKAAVIAVPSLSPSRYAIAVFLCPTLVYWPSSIGKEAWMMFCLGVATYGGALLLSGEVRLRSILVTAAGLVGAGFVRPHLAAIWVASITVGLIVGVAMGSGGHGGRSPLRRLVVVTMAIAGLVFVAGVTLRYLNPSSSDDSTASVGDQIESIFDETTRRSEQGGSSFDTVEIGGPQTWPYAIFRTLTRPLLPEARSFAELLPAGEMTLLMLAGVFGWRRLATLPAVLRRCPYLTFALIALLMFGLAFTTIGNLGILTRQRSLIMPLFLLPFCLSPDRWEPGEHAPVGGNFEVLSRQRLGGRT